MVTKKINKTEYLLTPSNQKKIDALCATIIEKCEDTLGWEQLTKISGFTHSELIALFQVYKQTTPMAFIKNARRLRIAASPVSPQDQLFTNLLKN
jgi:hypothetical protein